MSKVLRLEYMSGAITRFVQLTNLKNKEIKMARYTGPAFKKARRYGFSLLETGKEFSKGKQRTTAPGMHGARKQKLSDYGLHLYEKQKVRFIYGINERQFKRLFTIAAKNKGVTGTAFLQILESRLDNFVYRSGLAATRRQARQLVSHAHFTVNGKNVNIPSLLLKVGDVVELKAKSQANVQILEAIKAKPLASWITKKDFTFTMNRLPERAEINTEINEALVVEYYSK